MTDNEIIISLLTEIRDSLKKPETEKVNCKRTIVKVPYRDIVGLYHDILPDLPQVKALTPARRGYIKTLWLEDLPEFNNWTNFFNYVNKSDFLMGKAPPVQGRKTFIANLEWITKPANFLKILEGNFHG